MNVNGSASSFINLNKNKTETSLEKMANAANKKINDAALESVAGILNSQASALTQGVANANDNIAMLQIADGALSSVSDDTQSLNELSVKMNSAALNSEQKSSLNSEFSKLTQNIDRTIQGSSYNGQALFGRELETSIGSTTITSSIPSINSKNLDISSQDSISSFLTSVNSARGEIGSSSDAMQSSVNTLLKNITASTEAASNMTDVDIAKEVGNFNKSEMLLNSSIIAQAHKTDGLQNKMQMLLG